MGEARRRKDNPTLDTKRRFLRRLNREVKWLGAIGVLFGVIGSCIGYGIVGDQDKDMGSVFLLIALAFVGPALVLEIIRVNKGEQ